MDEFVRRRAMMELPSAQAGYVTDGLIAYWDGIDNTGGNGHDSTQRTWVDLIDGYTWNYQANTPTFGADGVTFAGVKGSAFYKLNSAFVTRPSESTLEVVATPTANATQFIMALSWNSDPLDSTYNASFSAITYSDNTVGFVGVSGNTYSTGLPDVTGIRKMTATYTGTAVDKAYINRSLLSLSNKTHSMRQKHNSAIGATDLSNQSANYPFTGTVHAIRLYNRKLTDAERAQNDVYDNARFNLNM